MARVSRFVRDCQDFSIIAKPRKCAVLHVSENSIRSWFDWLTMSGIRQRMQIVERPGMITWKARIRPVVRCPRLQNTA